MRSLIFLELSLVNIDETILLGLRETKLVQSFGIVSFLNRLLVYFFLNEEDMQ